MLGNFKSIENAFTQKVNRVAKQFLVHQLGDALKHRKINFAVGKEPIEMEKILKYLFLTWGNQLKF